MSGTSPLPGTVTAAPPNATGFDCDTVLTSRSASAFVDAGFSFVIRYLSRTVPESSGDLSASEANTILNAGLALMAVQHGSQAGWVPTQALGQQYGQSAVTNARSVGLPAGVNIWLDLEGVQSGTAASAVSAYCDTWFAEVAAAGYLPGLYVGSDCGLTGSQLGALNVSRYWESGSSVPMPSPRGYCMVQTIDNSYVLAGVGYDKDTTQPDVDGGTPVWLAPVATAQQTV